MPSGRATGGTAANGGAGSCDRADAAGAVVPQCRSRRPAAAGPAGRRCTACWCRCAMHIPPCGWRRDPARPARPTARAARPSWSKSCTPSETVARRCRRRRCCAPDRRRCAVPPSSSDRRRVGVALRRSPRTRSACPRGSRDALMPKPSGTQHRQHVERDQRQPREQRTFRAGTAARAGRCRSGRCQPRPTARHGRRRAAARRTTARMLTGSHCPVGLVEQRDRHPGRGPPTTRARKRLDDLPRRGCRRRDRATLPASGPRSPPPAAASGPGAGAAMRRCSGRPGGGAQLGGVPHRVVEHPVGAVRELLGQVRGQAVEELLALLVGEVAEPRRAPPRRMPRRRGWARIWVSFIGSCLRFGRGWT